MAHRRTWFGLLTLLTIGSLVRGQKECGNPIPGLDRIAQGVDITRLDLFHDYSSDPNDGFVSRVLQFHCDGGRIWKSPFDGRSYDVPDQVDNVVAMPTGMVIADSLLVKTTSELRNAMSVEVGLDLGADIGSFSASTTYTTSKYRLEEQDKLVATNKAFVSVAVISLAPSTIVGNSSLTPYFLDQLKQLPHNYELGSYGKYYSFFQTYGTHIFHKGNFGGSLSTWFEINKRITKVLNEESVKVQVRASFLGFLKAHGAYSGDVSAKDERFANQSTHAERYYGGQANLFDSEGYKTWWTTIAPNPWLHSGSLAPIHDLLSDDEPVKAGLKQAHGLYGEYVAMQATLKKVRQHLGNPLFRNSTLLTRLRDDIVDMLAYRKEVTRGTTASMDAELDRFFAIPDWFRESSLCFRYKDWETFCTPVGVTPDFRNDRDTDPCHFDLPACYNGRIFLKSSSPEGDEFLKKHGAQFSMEMTEIGGKTYLSAKFTVTGSDESEAPGWLLLPRLGMRWDDMYGASTRIRSTRFVYKPVNELLSTQAEGLWTARNIDPIRIQWFLLFR